MYIQDTSPQLDGLFDVVKSVLQAPAKIIQAVAKPVAKVVQETAKTAVSVVKKVAPLAVVAGTAYYAPQLLPAILARGSAAGGGQQPPMDESGAPAPARTVSQDPQVRAARAYYAARALGQSAYYPSPLPSSMPAQPSLYSEAQELTYAQPAQPAPAGGALANLKVPLIAAAAIGIPLLILATRSPESRR